MMKRQFKKLSIVTLIMSMVFTASAPASAEKPEKREKQNTQIAKLAKEFRVSEQFVQDELKKGTSTDQIGHALKLSKLTKKSYQDTLKDIKPQQVNKSKEAKSKITVDEALLAPTDSKLAVSAALVTEPDTSPPPNLGEKISEAPYTVALGDENISTLSGGLSLNASDMTLLGRNGLDFSLERTYSSQSAQLFDMSTNYSTSTTYDYQVLFDVKFQKQALGYWLMYSETQDYQEDRNGDFKPDYEGGIVISSRNATDSSSTSYTPSELASATTALKSKVSYGNWDTSTGLPYWRYVYEVNPYSISSTPSSTVKSIGTPSYGSYITEMMDTRSQADSYRSSIISKNGSIKEYSSWYSDSTYISVRDVVYYNDTAPEILEVPVGTTTNYYNVTVKSYDETLYPIGTGWSWKIPSVETTSGKKYVHLADGGVYEVSGSALKGYPWKDISYAADTSAVVGGVTSASVLKSETSGEKQYFDATGRLIKITDTYGNYVQFLYSNVATYGKVLTRIENSAGNFLTITYSPQEVRLTQGDRTVVYSKQVTAAASNKELLTSVTDEAGRRTTYDYSIKAARFNLLGSTPNTSNPYALVSAVTHPTGAKTVYQYETNATKRFLASSAVNETYRLASISDQLVYSDGTIENKNQKTLAYTGDMGSSYASDQTFSVSLQKDGVTTKFDQKKDYIDTATGSVYYNTKNTQSVNDEQRVVTQTFDEAKRLPVPNQVSTQYIKAGVPAEAVTTAQTYDEYGNTLTQTDPNGTVQTFAYDAVTHLLKSISEPLSDMQTKKTEITYNAQRKPTQVQIKENDQLLRQTNYQYDSYGNILTLTYKGTTGDRVQQYEYSTSYANVFPTKMTVQAADVDGILRTSSQSFEYHLPLGVMTKWTDGNGNITSYQYDKLGRMVQQTNPDLSTRIVNYLDLQNEVEVINELGLKTHSKFNQLGWMTQTGFTSGGVYQTTSLNGYDNFGRQIWSEDVLGNRIETKYDPWSREIEITNADQTRSNTVFDDALRSESTIDADGATERTTYDKLGQVVQNETFDAQTGTRTTQKFGYDLAGNTIYEDDEAGNRINYKYNAVQEMTSVTDQDGLVTTFTYDLLGNQTQVTYPDGKFTAKTYNAAGQTIQKIDPAGQMEKYYYDAAGNLLTTIDRKGVSKTNTYSNRNFLLSKSTPTDNVSFEYDLAGKRIKMTDKLGESVYSYTELGRLKSVRLPDGKSISYVYDLAGNRTKMTDPFGREIFYGINSRNQIETVAFGSDSSSPEAEYTYNAVGQVKTEKLRNGITSNKAYDANKYLTGFTQTDATGSEINKFGYQYDAVGNQTQKVENGAVFNFTYDKQRRILTSSQFAETYSYDVRGNRQSLQTDRDQEMSDGEYAYDEWNRLIRVTNTDGTAVEYTYTGDDLLYERKENGAVTRYYYDGEEVIAEADVKDGVASLKVRYLRGNGLVALETADGEKAYYLHNGHGDVTQIRDENGSLLNQYSYDIWGNVISKLENVHNSFRYAGELQDPTTSLIYLRARWYDPNTGRFINEDTYEGQISDPLTLNLYTYAQNNPLLYVDPTGHNAWEVYLYQQTGWHRYKTDFEYTWRNLADIAGWNAVGKDLYTFLYSKDPKEISQALMGLAVSVVPFGAATKTVKIGGKTFKSSGLAKLAGKACNCFVEGTQILTEDGKKPIEEIEVGDKVLSKDEQTGETAYKEVTQLFRNDKQIIYELTVGDQLIETTDNHPFWVEGKGWLLAADLKVGDQLQQSNGSKLAIDHIKIVEHDEKVKVYNFTVADFHTYFVSDLGIWVHNIGGCLTGADIKFSDKFAKSEYKNQVKNRLWSNDLIASTINNPVKTGASTNKYTGNSVTLYYIDNVHYVAIDNGTKKVIQVSDRKVRDWKLDLTK